jgi:hypothetical protein
MQILTLEDQQLLLSDLPDVVDDKLRFAVLDNSDNQNPDYFFLPLRNLESFTGPAVVLKIGNHEIAMPLDWCTIVGDPEGPDLEILPLTSLNDRGFRTFVFNPLSSSRPEFYDIDIINIYQEVRWHFPKMKPGQLLCTPLTSDKNPPCVYFVKEVSRQCEVVQYCKVW